MIKAITLIRRLPGMELDAFRDYWLHTHPACVLALPGLRRYVQSHPLLGGYKKGPLPFDGVAETWFDDIDTLRRNAKTEAYEAVAADEKNFIDPATIVLLLVEDRVIKDGAVPEDGVKAIEMIRRKPGMAVEDYRRYWHDVHGPIAARIPVLRRYVQSHPLIGAYRGGRQPHCDGLALTWFDHTDAMRQSAKTTEYAETRDDEGNFIDQGAHSVLLAKEYVIKA